MNVNLIKALLDMLVFYFDSVSEWDQAMVLTILEGMVEVLRR